MQYRQYVTVVWYVLSVLIQAGHVGGNGTETTSGDLLNQCGKQFVFTFLKNLDSETLKLWISAFDDTSVTISNSFHNVNISTIILAGKSEIISLSSTILPSNTEPYGHRAVHIKSTGNITVYAYNFCAYSSASFTVLPVRALGTRYFLASFGRVSDNEVPTFSISATEDNTTVSIILRITNNGYCGSPALTLTDSSQHKIRLDKYEDFSVYCTGDPTGSSVSSDNPVAVVSGHVGSMVPLNILGRDEMAEMLPPVRMYGRRYVLHGPARNRGAVFRIIGSQANTDLAASDGLTRILQNGDFIELDLSAGDTLCIKTSNPVMVVMYGKGAESGPNKYGDPFMIVIPPVESFGHSFYMDMSILNMPSFSSSVSLVMKTFYTHSLGSDYDVQTIPSCLYSVVTHTVTDGRMNFSLPQGATYMALVYSFDYFEGNGLSLGTASDSHNLWKDCPSNPCRNNGTCEEDLFTYTCNCLSGFTGRHCEETMASSATSFGLTPPPTTAWASTYSSILTNSDYTFGFSAAYESSVLRSSATHVSTYKVLDTSMNAKSPFKYSNELSLTTALKTSVSRSLHIMTTSLPPEEGTFLTSANGPTSVAGSVSVDASVIEVQHSSTIDVSVSYSSTTVTALDQSGNMTMVSSTTALSTTVTTKSYDSCPCKCPANYSDKEMVVLIKNLKEEIQTTLQLDKDVLSKTVRQRISVPDDRPSARFLGGGGIAVLVSIFVVFVVSDFVKIAKDLIYGLRK